MAGEGTPQLLLFSITDLSLSILCTASHIRPSIDGGLQLARLTLHVSSRAQESSKKDVPWILAEVKTFYEPVAFFIDVVDEARRSCGK